MALKRTMHKYFKQMNNTINISIQYLNIPKSWISKVLVFYFYCLSVPKSGHLFNVSTLWYSYNSFLFTMYLTQAPMHLFQNAYNFNGFILIFDVSWRQILKSLTKPGKRQIFRSRGNLITKETTLLAWWVTY